MWSDEGRVDYRLPSGHWSANQEWVSTCPACGGKDKLYFNVELALGCCFGGGCGVRIVGWRDLEDLFEGRMEGLSFMAIRATGGGRTDRVAAGLPPGDPWTNATTAAFFRGRGITPVTTAAVPIGMRGGRLVAPVDPLSPEYPHEHYVRTADGSGKWVPMRDGVKRKHYAFGWRSCRREHDGREVVILEGLLDLMALGLVGRAVAIMGTDFPSDLAEEMRREGMRATCWFDPDKAGTKCRQVGMDFLQGWGVPARIFPLKVDPKVATREDLRGILEDVYHPY